MVLRPQTICQYNNTQKQDQDQDQERVSEKGVKLNVYPAHGLHVKNKKSTQ